MSENDEYHFYTFDKSLISLKSHEMNKSIVEKYNIAGPRYTSYPTVPFWKNDPLEHHQWLSTIEKNDSFFQSDDISLYIHLPFCESLCTFCGCHKRITKNHTVEKPYIDAVIKEWEMYKSRFTNPKNIRELHFGGGTPTFFAPEQLIRLLEAIFDKSSVDPDYVELSFEAHPNNTSFEHLQKLYDFGFRRLSLGIQDYSPTVQQAINRIQPFEQVEKVHEEARRMGYKSVSHDLIFGLPKQTLQDIKNTVENTLKLMPDRIALYSYAHVPWIKGNGQRGFDESDLPQNDVKRKLYETAKETLENAGYIEIGMDHFALPHDDLAIAFVNKTLHRNFMGYTTQNTSFLLGLGMSAISDSWFGFAQNDKVVESYIKLLEEDKLPVVKGHVLNDLELEIRKYILDLMCHFETTFKTDSPFIEIHTKIKSELTEMIADGLVVIEGNHVQVTNAGIPFVRNCCMAFDQDLNAGEVLDKKFSSTI